MTESSRDLSGIGLIDLLYGDQWRIEHEWTRHLLAGNVDFMGHSRLL